MAHTINSEDLQPGDKVSIDQLESSTPGYVDTFKGKPMKASIYVDYASQYLLLNVFFQQMAWKHLNNLQHHMASR